MIQISFEQGRYHVQPRTEAARKWLTEYVANHPVIQMSGGGPLIDPRFLSDLLEHARRVGLRVELR